MFAYTCCDYGVELCVSRKMTLREAQDFCENMKAGGWNNTDIAERLEGESGYTLSVHKSEDRTMSVFSFPEGMMMLTHYGEIECWYMREEDKKHG
jgi:hypothetical protein